VLTSYRGDASFAQSLCDADGIDLVFDACGQS